MTNDPPASPLRHAVVTIGFAMAVCMWLVGYLGRMPVAAAHVPGGLLVPLMLLVCVAGGWLVRSGAHGGIGAAAVAGLIAGLVNLLIVGSVIATLPDDARAANAPTAALWIPGSLLATAIAAALGALVARPCACAPYPTSVWRARFIAVAALATLLTLVAGGIVTSAEEGLAVPDWPTSFGANMFLYPLRNMTGGIFLEHAHRLYGSLVGVTMIVMLVMTIIGRRRPEIVVAILCMVLVVVQGYIGGRRVTDTSVALAAIHGVLGQVFFALVTVAWAIAVRDRQAPAPADAPRRTLDRRLTHVLTGLTLVQVVFGAMYRHMYTPEAPLPWPAHVHLLFAAILPVLAGIVSFRAWAGNAAGSMLRRLGAALGVVIVLQVLLGIGALIALFVRPEGTGPPPVEIVLATAHQATGAVFYAITVQLAFWTRRA